MSHEDRQPLAHRADEIARLFVRIADERPAVLDALHALLKALAPAEAARVSAPEAEEEAEAVPLEPESNGLESNGLESNGLGSNGTSPIGADPPTTSPAAVPTRPLPRVPVEPTAEAKRGLDQLMSMFGDLGGSSGLGVRTSASAQETFSSRWDDDIDEARRLARLLRAQARRLRSVRLAAHDGRAIPPVDHVLADARIDDWTADTNRIAALAAHDLREGERWYTLAARAVSEIGGWLSEHPDAELGGGATPDALRDRLQCLANAQKGIHCWIEQTLGIGRHCAVQLQALGTLKAWVARDYFAVYLPSGLVLAQRITSAERDDTARALQRFELEHASVEHASVEHASVEPAEPSSPEHRTRQRAAVDAPGQSAGHGDRFDSVHAAFLAARAQFADGLVVFTERAEESAEDSAFKRPDEVFDFFAALHGIAAELREGLLEGRRLDLVFAERGFKSKPCATTTMKRYRRFYHMAYERSEVDLSQHVTLGSRNQNTCMSIHWWHDKANRRFVIGHCGKHLPNTMT